MRRMFEVVTVCFSGYLCGTVIATTRWLYLLAIGEIVCGNVHLDCGENKSQQTVVR